MPVGAIVLDRPCRNCEIAFDLTYTAIPASQGVARNAPTWDCWCILRDIVIHALRATGDGRPYKIVRVISRNITITNTTINSYLSQPRLKIEYRTLIHTYPVLVSGY